MKPKLSDFSWGFGCIRHISPPIVADLYPTLKPRNLGTPCNAPKQTLHPPFKQRNAELEI